MQLLLQLCCCDDVGNHDIISFSFTPRFYDEVIQVDEAIEVRNSKILNGSIFLLILVLILESN